MSPTRYKALKLQEGRILKEMEAIIDELFTKMGTRDDLTWKEVAELAGLSPSTVRKLRDNVTRLPGFLTIVKLTQVVGVALTLEQKKTLKVYKSKVG